LRNKGVFLLFVKIIFKLAKMKFLSCYFKLALSVGIVMKGKNGK
jgi:hypothetical protein